MTTPTPPEFGADSAAGSRLLGTNGLQAVVDRLTTAVDKLASVAQSLGSPGPSGTSTSTFRNTGQTFTSGSFPRMAPAASAFSGGAGAGAPPTGGQGGSGSNSPGALQSAGQQMMQGAVQMMGQSPQFSNQILMNQFASMSTLGMGPGNVGSQQRQMYQMAFGSYNKNLNALAFNPADAAQMYSNLQGIAASPNVMGTALGRAGFGATAGFGYANPSLGGAGASQAAAQLYSGQTSMMMRQLGYGATPRAPGGMGNPMQMSGVMQSILQRAYGRGSVNQNTLNAGLADNGKLRLNLQALGLDPSTMGPALQMYNKMFSQGVGASQAQTMLNDAAHNQNYNGQSAQKLLSNKYGIATGDLTKLKDTTAVQTGTTSGEMSGFDSAISQATTSVQKFDTVLNSILKATGLGTILGAKSGFAGAMGSVGGLASKGMGMLTGILGGAAGPAGPSGQGTPGSTTGSRPSGAAGKAIKDAESQLGRPYCVPLRTKILTRRGWISHDEVRVGDETIGFNIDTGRSEWTRVTEVVHFEDAPVIRYGTKRWSVESTEDHRWVVYSEKDPKPRIRRVNELGSSFFLKVAAEADTGDDLPISDIEAEILGWVAGDGHVRYDTLYISQSKENRIEELRELLSGIPHTEYEDRSVRENRKIKHVFRVRTDYSRDLMQRAGHPKLDAFNQVLAMSSTQRAAWLRGMVAAEGSPNGARHVNVYQTDGPIADALELAIYLTGHRPSKSKLTGKDQWTPCFSHGICGDSISLRVRNFFREDAGTADVWCVRTELETWTAEQDGQIFLTGNTWGGDNPAVGFDCSGLIEWAYGQAGVKLPRTSQQQWAALSNRSVSLDKVMAGDILFSAGSDGSPNNPGHEAMAISGSQIIEAPHTGANIRIRALDKGEWSHAARPTGSMTAGGGGGGGTSGANGNGPASTSVGSGNAGLGLAVGNYGSSSELENTGSALLGGISGGSGMAGFGSIGNGQGSTGTSGSGGGNTNVSTAGGGSISANRALGQRMAKQMYGWTGSEWDALNKLWGTYESGWNNKAQNSGSTAFGIAQFLDSTWQPYGPKTSDAGLQIKYGLEYIHDRYKDPVNALKFELSHTPHWYDGGTDSARPGYALLGERGPELVKLGGGQQVMNASKTADILSGSHAKPGQTPWDSHTARDLFLAPVAQNNAHKSAGKCEVNLNMPAGAIVVHANGTASDASNAVRQIMSGIRAAMAEDDMIAKIQQGVMG